MSQEQESTPPRRKITVSFRRQWLVLPADSDLPCVRLIDGPPPFVMDDPALGAMHWIAEVKHYVGRHGPGIYIGTFTDERGEAIRIRPWDIEVTDEDARASGYISP